MYQPDKLAELVKDRCAGPKPFTLEHLTAWLRSQDPSETYDIMSPSDCLLCRYTGDVLGRKAHFSEAMAHGMTQARGWPAIVAYGSTESVAICQTFEHSVRAALERALALQATSRAVARSPALSKAGATI